MSSSHARREQLDDLSRAIDYVGPRLYGPDWIDHLSPSETTILKKFGPQPYGATTQLIGRCPPRLAVRLDRVVGRDRRMMVQRATVLEWIFRSRVMTTWRDRYDETALDRALQQEARLPSAPGRPAAVYERVLLKMLSELRAGAITLDQLARFKQKELAHRYGAALKVCAQARKVALPEARRLTSSNLAQF